MTKLASLQQDYEKAVSRLREVLREPKTEIIRDSAIKRFEIAFDLSWKTLKTYLEDKHNLIANSPQNCFREAYKTGLLEYDEFWLEIAKLRNLSVHTYEEKLAEEIFGKLPKILDYFLKLQTAISE